MNNRFKFRVWSKKHNRYIVDSHYPIGSDHIIVIKQDGKAYNLGLGDYEDYSNMHSWAVMEEFTDCILEQCTGLKDNCGNLIYEGDIVRCDRDFSENGRKNLIRKVMFADGSFQLERAKTIGDRYYINAFHNFEIIGNIHEQAEQKDVK